MPFARRPLFRMVSVAANVSPRTMPPPQIWTQRKEGMTNVVITGAARTAVGSYGKSLKDVPPSDLGATAAGAALERAGLEPERVDHVVFGNVIHTDAEDMYMARVVGMKTG